VLAAAATAQYLIGTGIGDVTGPAAEVNLMGYAQANQTAAGIHLRLFARAFIVADNSTGNRVAFVSVDWGMASLIVKNRVVDRLQQTYGDLYTQENLCLSGTHSHSTPAGFLEYVLFQITSLGFVNESATAYVDGIYESIVQAHENLAPGNLSWNWGELEDANINRSPSAYLANPAEERAMYDGNTDYNMTLLKFSPAGGPTAGFIAWYAVHGTSMNNSNLLLSSDNKGYAGLLTEQRMNGPNIMPGHGPFVAAFPSTNLGDVSPNTNGTVCYNSGLPCDFNHSTCGGWNEYCVGRGPGKDMFDSTRIIGERQADFAASLLNSTGTPIAGPVSYIHTYLQMSNTTVSFNGSTATTCAPAMGYSFAAGTTDGPGAFNFTQGDPGTGTPFWNLIRDLIADPPQAMIDCHAPKPILLPTGIVGKPYAWDPDIVPLQILRVGQLFIVAVPSEFTTMGGRRLRAAVREAVIAAGGPSDAVIVISGLSNSYSSYVTTFEEYQVQRYEGASTIYGPHTHAAYVQNYVRLAQALVTGTAYPPGPTPPDLSSQQISLLPGVVLDTAPVGKNFGDVIVDALPVYSPGETVSVTFVSANPRNDPLRGKTFLTVQALNATGAFVTVFTDAHFETRYSWTRPSIVSSESNAVITWTIPPGTTGKFRIQHFGTAKPLVGPLTPFQGTSSLFAVVPNSQRRTYGPQ